MEASPPRIYRPVEEMRESELIDAMSDAHWRIRNLYKIKDKDGNTVTFRPNEAQDKFLDRLWFRNLVPKARQRGFSTCKQILTLDTCLFTPQTNAAIIAQDRDTASRIRDGKIKFAYDRLPPLIRDMVPLTTDNQTELAWGNDSSMSVSTSVRGGTIDILHVSEYGLICLEDPIKAREIQEGSLPAVPANGIATIESTVESPYGIFSDMVKHAADIEKQGRALTKLDYRLHFASWWDAEEYELPPDGIIISPQEHAYFARMEAVIGRPISLRKRAWYVTVLASQFGGEKAKMWRQYPTTLDEAFTVAANGLWLAEQMAICRVQGRIGDIPLVQGVPVNTFWDLGTDDATAIWLHQHVGAWDHFIGFIECSGEPPSYYVSELQKIREERKFVWGKHYLPHDGAHRRMQTERLVTYKDMIEEVGLKDIEIVPRADSVEVEIQLMRQDFSTYRFDETHCKAGIEHLDGFAKVFNKTMQVFTSAIAKNGHQHAADALRQKASAGKHGMLNTNTIAKDLKRSRKRRSSAMTS
jgi:hypothetical protein